MEKYKIRDLNHMAAHNKDIWVFLTLFLNIIKLISYIQGYVFLFIVHFILCQKQIYILSLLFIKKVVKVDLPVIKVDTHLWVCLNSRFSHHLLVSIKTQNLKEKKNQDNFILLFPDLFTRPLLYPPPPQHFRCQWSFFIF